MSGFRTVGSGKSIAISNEQMAEATKILGVHHQEDAGMGCNGSNFEKSDVSYRMQGRVESVLDTNTSGGVGTGFHRHYRDNTNNAIHHNSSPPNKATGDHNDDMSACVGSNIATHPSTGSRPSVMSGFRTVGSGKSIAISNEQMAEATKILGVNHQERVTDGFHKPFVSDGMRSLESLGSMDFSKDKDIILSDNQGPSSCKTSVYYKNAELRAGKRIQSSLVLPIVTPASLASNDFNNRERVVACTTSSPRERLRHTPIHEMANIVHDSLQSAMKSKRLFGSTVKARKEKSIKYSKVALSQIGANNLATKVSTWASCIEHGVNDVTMRVTSVNAIKLRFNIHDNMPLFFMGQIYPPKCTNVGKITDILDWLCCQGCDKTLVTEKWIKNHYRWIVWKLAAMERRFPEQLGGHYLTFSHVLSQIKGRYEKELCRANRPAVRKILNRDVSPCVPIILCISQILRFKSKTPQNGGDQCAGKEGIEEIRLEASDGWYALSAMLDGILSNLVDSGKIRVGSKLMICNAQLVGSEDGIDPLDDDYHSDRRNCRLVLQITANNTRLARWDAKLGFVHPKYTAQQGGSILIKNLSGIFPDGGTIPTIDLVICKRYPRMFLEQVKDDNSFFSNHLTEADEAAHQNDHDINHQRASEKYADIAGTECSEVRIIES
jgi:breast cancer 2 susceptibility protein